jgi:alkylation response protein AidB-like acyl-CoA dehydrogenase
MDFSMPDGLDQTLEEIEAFVDDELLPLESLFLEGAWDELEAELEAARQKVRDRGWWTPHLDTEHGGMGLSLPEFGLVAEVLGRTPLGHYAFNCQAPDAGNMELLLSYANQQQQEAYLERLLAGEIRSCFAMTEPDRPGSNPTWMQTTAELAGGEYTINGRKWFTSGAEGAEFAIVMAVTDPDASDRYAQASQLLVPAETEGFEVVRNVPVMGEEGRGYFSHGEVVFDDCRVPRRYRLGPEGAGFRMAQERLGPGRIHHSMRWIGICQRAFDLMCRRANERELAPGKPLADKQMVQQKIAESRAEIDAARSLTLQVADEIERQGHRASRQSVSKIKYFVADVLQSVLDRAIQVHGASGLTDETPLSWWYRHERGARIYDGVDEVHKKVVAESCLKERRESDG